MGHTKKINGQKHCFYQLYFLLFGQWGKWLFLSKT